MYPPPPTTNNGQPGQGPPPQEVYPAPSDYTGYTETVTLDEGSTGKTIPLNAHLAQSDLVTEILTNRQLLIPKGFYFFFYAAFGSLFPLMAVYFKQMGMNSTQAGFLIGIRPFIEIFSAPFWSGLADRFRTGKIMLLASLFSWIVFTCALAYIRPPASACVIYNATHHILYTPYSDETDENFERKVTERGKRTAPGPVHPALLAHEMFQAEELAREKKNGHRHPIMKKEAEVVDVETDAPQTDNTFWLTEIDPAVRHHAPPGHIIGKSPTSIDYTLNYNKDKHASYVSPAFSSIVYKWEDVKEVFFLLLLLVLLGEFFSAPAITLADSATLSYLGENTDLYGRQRMFGSAGWAISMFFVGMVLDGSTDFPGHPCLAHERERNYKSCFTIFAVLMALSLAVATQFKFEYDESTLPAQSNEIPLNPFEAKQPTPRPIFNTAPPINPPPGAQPERKFEFLNNMKSAVFAQRQREMPEWITVMRNFANLRYGTFLFVVWFMGLGIGLVFAFLFWHLQDLGGTPTLFGMASVLNHVSEIIAYFHSFKYIKELGHTRVLCIGLAGNVGRFLYISWIDNSWWVLPFEFVQGVTHAAVWAACCSYITQATEPHMRTQTLGVLQGLHHGLGRGCGAILGGYFINVFGSRATFCCYGLMSAVVLAFFIFVNYQRTDRGYRWNEDEAGHQVVFDEGAGLAPHGVPSAPVTRSLSKTNLNADGSTANPFGPPPATYQSTDGYLDTGAHYGGNVGGVGYNLGLNSNLNFEGKKVVIEPTNINIRRATLNPFTNLFRETSKESVSTEYEVIEEGFRDLSEVTNESRDSAVDGKLSTMVAMKSFKQQPQGGEVETDYNW